MKKKSIEELKEENKDQLINTESKKTVKEIGSKLEKLVWRNLESKSKKAR